MEIEGESPPLLVGTVVKIRHANFARTTIAEYRGRLAPGGVRVYRVRYRGKPRPAYVEVREDQLEVIPQEE